MEFPPVLKKIIGFALILMSIGFLGKLIAMLPHLISEFSFAVNGNGKAQWGSFAFYLLLNVGFWVVTYFMFRIGRKMFKSN